MTTHNTENQMENAEYVERDGKKYPWVEVRDKDAHEWLKRVLLADFGNVFLACANRDENYFTANKVFQITQWAQMRPIPRKKYRPYETLEECMHLIGETLTAKESSIYGDIDVYGIFVGKCRIAVMKHDGNQINAPYIAKHYTHNGQPCGVEV
jgi:hypothetical protein